MKIKITKDQEAHAQALAAHISHVLGNSTAAKTMRVSPSLLWRWRHGKTSPTPGSYEKLKAACEKLGWTYAHKSN